MAQKHFRGRLSAAAAALLLLLGGAPSLPEPGREARLRAIRLEIERLEGELASLRSREEGVLGELESLGTELRLREAEHREVTLRLEATSEAIAARNEILTRLELAQEQRRRYLTFRLREIYKEGPEQALRRLVGGPAVEEYWSALRYADYLSERDAREMREYRADAARLGKERAALLAEREELGTLQHDLEDAERRLSRAGQQRRRLLAEIRQDKSKREAAVAELRAASTALSELVGALQPGGAPPALDVRKFKGLLDWPADGEVSAGFGSMVHPRFKTRVPHPGLDIEGKAGENIKCVFDGRVLFASWMRGYGLTAIVDHGGGLLSVYAHASALLVEPGEDVVRGQTLGKIGDTGSLRGPFLYFELRVDGEPEDPRRWLRPR